MQHRRAAALLPAVALVALIATPIVWRLTASPTLIVPEPAVMPAPAFAVEAGQGESDLHVSLLRAGVSPDALAAVGVPTNVIATLVTAAQAHVSTEASSIPAADAAYASAKRESDRLRRLIESGKARQEDVAAYATQTSALAAATSAQALALQSLFDAATGGLSSEQRTRLMRIHAAKTWGLPLEFGVVERSQADWVELRGALANERFAAKYGEEPDQAAAAYLAHARVDQAVASARSSLDANRAVVTSAWNTALSD